MEDYYEDIISKAQHGLKLSDKELCEQKSILRSELDAAKAGHFNPKIAEKLAQALKLHPQALKDIGSQGWTPQPIVMHGLQQFTTPFGTMRVNAYLVRDLKTQACAIFDTGSDALPIIDVINSHDLIPKFLFLTHSHPDHVMEAPRFKQEYPKIDVHIGENETGVTGAKVLKAGQNFELGSLKVSSRSTPGHSPGGITYLIEGLQRPIAIVGDAIFSGSMGGAPLAYQEAQDAVNAQILTLPGNTILCPGHGPMTTVDEEKAHNPFFAK